MFRCNSSSYARDVIRRRFRLQPILHLLISFSSDVRKLLFQGKCDGENRSTRNHVVFGTYETLLILTSNIGSKCCEICHEISFS